MRRAAYLLAALMACTAVCGAHEGAGHPRLILSGVVQSLDKLAQAVKLHHEEAVNAYADKHPHSLLARHQSGDSSHKQRRLLSTQGVQDFLSSLLGDGWKDAVPSAWSDASFDWSRLGEFEYSSTLVDFLEGHEVSDLTEIPSFKDLTKSMRDMEAAFCTKEDFSHSQKVPAECVGPSVTMRVTPKVCVFDSSTKQVVCEPAKLVLIKTPGSCTHKYNSASSWVGKECKLSGSAGFADSLVLGGESKSIPLTQLVVSYTPDEEDEVVSYTADEKDEGSSYTLDEKDEVVSYTSDETAEVVSYTPDEKDEDTDTIPLTQLDVSYTPDEEDEDTHTAAPTPVCTGAYIDASVDVERLTDAVTLPATGGPPECASAFLSLTKPAQSSGCTRSPTEFVGDGEGIFFVADPGCETSADVPAGADLTASGADFTITAVQVSFYDTDQPPCFLSFTFPNGSQTAVEINGRGLYDLPTGGFKLLAGESGYKLSVAATTEPYQQLIQIQRFYLA